MTYACQRIDESGGQITYEITCLSPYYVVCQISDFLNDHAKRDAEYICKLLNDNYKSQPLTPEALEINRARIAERIGQFKARLYHLIVKKTNGDKVYLTAYPMTHDQCRIVKSKQSDATINKVQFEEVTA